jgi:hypothetical protein
MVKCTGTPHLRRAGIGGQDYSATQKDEDGDFDELSRAGWRIENGGRTTAGSSAGSAPDHCSETAVTPLHTLSHKHLRIFEPLHSPLHSVTFRYIFGCVITAAPGAILPLTPSRAAVWRVLGSVTVPVAVFGVPPNTFLPPFRRRERIRQKWGAGRTPPRARIQNNI